MYLCAVDAYSETEKKELVNMLAYMYVSSSPDVLVQSLETQPQKRLMSH